MVSWLALSLPPFADLGGGEGAGTNIRRGPLLPKITASFKPPLPDRLQKALSVHDLTQSFAALG